MTFIGEAKNKISDLVEKLKDKAVANSESASTVLPPTLMWQAPVPPKAVKRALM